METNKKTEMEISKLIRLDHLVNKEDIVVTKTIGSDFSSLLKVEVAGSQNLRIAKFWKDKGALLEINSFVIGKEDAVNLITALSNALYLMGTKKTEI